MFSKTKDKAAEKPAVNESDQNTVEGFPMGDRCDGCGFRVYVKATHDRLGTFKFCNHHFEQHKEKLAELGFTFDDRSAALKN